MTKQIVIPSNPVAQAIKVDLAGKPLTIFPMKAYALMKLSNSFAESEGDSSKNLEVLFQWLKGSTSPKDYEKTVARLEDPKDGLDIPQLAELFKQVAEESTGNPTT